MNKFRFTIRNRIRIGFLLLILIFSGFAVWSILTVNKSDKIINLTAEVVRSSRNALNELNTLVIRSKMHITFWVFMSNNGNEKKNLTDLINVQYPELKDRLNQLKQNWQDTLQQQKLNTILTKFDSMILVDQEIMENLKSLDDYDDLEVFTNASRIEFTITEMSAKIQEQLQELINAKNKETEAAEQAVMTSHARLKNNTRIIVIGIILLCVLGAFYLSNSITNPIKYIKDVIQQLGLGILPEDQKRKFNNDEIGEMATAVDKLVNGLKSTSYFAESIGKGDYQSDYEPLSENDVLGNALIEMRDNLQTVAQEDARRNWATEGLARFGEILRNNNDNINNLSDEIVSNLVKYMKANQGALFVVESPGEDEEDYLTLTACYAWDKKKFLEQKVYEGDGLTGQAWMEKDIVYVTDVPDNFVSITSGLGEANPNCVLIVPLKVNDQVYGIVELASFNEIKDFEIDFVEKIAESIASTISSVKINERTQHLLEESTELTEQMRAQEEEMRQNMEELQATQEEMQRTQREREDKERIIHTTHILFEIDENLTLLNVNDKVREILGYDPSDLTSKTIEAVIKNPEALHQMKKMVEKGLTWSGKMVFYNKNREEILLHGSAGQSTDPLTQNKRVLLFALDPS